MRHCPTEAYSFLEAREPGLYNGLVRTTLECNGIVHAAPDCFCLAIPAPDDPRTVVILFQCSALPALWRLAMMYCLRFDKVRFRRDFKNGYPERSVPMARFMRKAKLAALCSQFPHPTPDDDV